MPLTKLDKSANTYPSRETSGKKCGGSIKQIEDGILNSSVAGTDATVVTTNGKQTYIRNFSTDDYVLYIPMAHKDIESMKEIGVMAQYTGIFVNDHETAAYHFGKDNAECNVHLIRYLTKTTQECGGHMEREIIKSPPVHEYGT